MSPEIVQAVIFYFLAAMLVVSCAIVVFSHSIVNACFALLFTLLAVAGFYALLGADFLAVTQVVVYVGGILVLLLFGILLTSPLPIVLGVATRRTYYLAVAAGAAVFAMLMIIVRAFWAGQPAVPEQQSTLEALGMLLLGKYLFPFEFASLTLLAALIGAAYLVRRNDR
ncbi:MAG: NADH-quinone oxidoreductase subunit J [Candidatus Sumerlaeia bacterium]|nr:NADH-quinone oxidoreductase subunit J [Candidatus Sumerlaeia bacterium]